MVARSIAVAMALVLATAPAAAGPSGPGTLSVADVLRSVRTSHPKLAAAVAKLDEARGDRLAARAVFDPVAEAKGSNLVAGYYEYWLVQSVIKQQLGVGGIDMSAGYRLGRGDIPPYYGELATRSGGEVFSSLRLPLLNGRSIDDGRAKLRKARLKVRATAQLRRATALGLARDAQLAYWEWVGAAQKLTMARQLLALANERAARVDARARQGALPRIVIVDNRRVVLARQSKVYAARRSFVKAQAKLSLYYRDANSRPQLVAADRAPALGGGLPDLDERRVDTWIAEAMRARPELALLQLDRRATRIDQELAKNDRLPVLDLRASVARDLGVGAASLGSTDVAVGISFELPLFRRKARGRLRSARAKLIRLEATRRGTRDRVAAQVKMYVRLAKLAHQRWRLARDRVAATQRLAAAERTRFERGASDMIRVNLRELAVASAAGDAIDASVELHRARANLLLARGLMPPSLP